MSYKLLGEDFTPPDVPAKVTGKAKYAEDFQVAGMVHAKLLLSPLPHGQVVELDASQALAMDGVLGVLTADDLPAVTGANEPILTNEPLHVGAPIAAIVADTGDPEAEAIPQLVGDYTAARLAGRECESPAPTPSFEAMLASHSY